MRHFFLPCLFIAWIQASPAHADPPNPRPRKAGDYSYVFHDDPLAAGGLGPTDPRIRVRPWPWRTTLIRSRTDFVPELLEAVEDL